MDPIGYPLYTSDLHDEDRPAIADHTPRAFGMDTFRATVGPGWYESSRELVRGLTVLEGPLAELALNEWLKNPPSGR